MQEKSKNVPNWVANEKDYRLLFCLVEDEWRECSHNLPKYNNMLLADYLAEMQICIPDYTQFLRIYDDERNLHFEYRCYGGRIRIDVAPWIFD